MSKLLVDLASADAMSRFEDVAQRDKRQLELPDYLARWLFVERLHARGVRKYMSFDAYLGPSHIVNYFHWIMNARFNDFFDRDTIDDLVKISVRNDMAVLDCYGLTVPAHGLANVGRYNAQDFLYQRAYAVPDRLKVRTMLDFGAGHGRMANLNLRHDDHSRRIQAYIAVDGIAASYLTQSAYFRGLSLRVWDYFDHRDEDPTVEVIERALQENDVIHLPTWRLDLVPDGVVDMVNCVQVLKELPSALVVYAIRQFRRVTQKAGAIYLRDHLQFHNPNHMPVDQILEAEGFRVEYAPQLIDRVETHGLPRIWRKLDPDIYVMQEALVSPPA